MKWLKRLLLLVVFAVVFAAVSGAVGWWMARGTPDWYQTQRKSPQELAAAAGRAEQQVQRTLSWAQDQQALAVSSRLGAPSTKPARTLEISVTEDELNGFFQKWDATFGWSSHYSRYLSDPQVVLRNGRVILAGEVKETGTVMSIELAPRLAEGRLWMPVSRVMAGRLPLPRALWGSYRQKLEDSIGARLPEWKQQARISQDGAANADAVAAAMTELLLDALDDRPAPPVLFLPYSLQGSPRSVPVNVTALQVTDNTLTLTVEPMNLRQRQSLLATIRSSDQAQLAPAPMDALVAP